MLERDTTSSPRDAVKSSIETFQIALGEFSSRNKSSPYPYGELDMLLNLTHYSNGFKDFVRKVAQDYFDPEALLEQLGVDILDNELGAFEPGNEHQIEKEFLQLVIDDPTEAGFYFNSAKDQEELVSSAAEYLNFVSSWGVEFSMRHNDQSLNQAIEKLRVFSRVNEPHPIRKN